MTAAHRNLLIASRLLNIAEAIHYSSKVAATRWGDSIARLLAERGWTRRQLAKAASVRPNTLTNLLKHSKDSDTATLTRIASAFNVDIVELFLTKEQSVVLQAHQESRVERLRGLVVRELSETVTKLVRQELEGSGTKDDSPTYAPLEKSAVKPRRRPKRPAR